MSPSLNVGEGVCEVRSTSGDTHLGGDDFDKRLVDWVADEFKKDSGIDVRQDRQAFNASTRRRRKPSASFPILPKLDQPAFHYRRCNGAETLGDEATRAKFEDLTHDLVQRCMKPVNRPWLMLI